MDDNFGIGQAVKEMQNGYRVRRAGWNGKGMWLALQAGSPELKGEKPEQHVRERSPYVYMKTADDKIIPWLCSQADLLAIDWQIAGEPDVSQ